MVRSSEVQVPSSRSQPEHDLIRVLLVQPDPTIRTEQAEMLGRGGYDVIAVRSLAEAGKTLRIEPDVHAGIIEYQLPDGTAPELVQLLNERQPLCRSVVMTAATQPEAIQASARAGTHVHLRSPSNLPELLDAVSRTVRSTLEWRDAMAPAGEPAHRGLANQDAPPPVYVDLQRAVSRLRYVANLSPAETMTAWRLLWGDSNRRMAHLMGCTERTVKFHVAEVLARTGARSRAGLLRVLLEDAGIRDPWQHRGALLDHDDREDR